MGGCVGDGCSKLPGASILDDPVVRWDPLHCEYCSFPSLEFLANVGGSGTGNPRGEMGVAVCRPLARCTVRIGMSAPPLSPTARLPNSPTTTIRNAAETLEELKGVAQALREGDTAANAVAEALKQGEASKADLLKALRRRNQMRQGVKFTIERMGALKALTDELLLLRGSSTAAGNCEAAVSDMCEASRELVAALRPLVPLPAHAPLPEASRSVALEAELAAVRAACPPSTAEVLCTAITRLRGIEDSVSFHSGLVKAVADASSDGGYSKDNFAYGSTPFGTWQGVMRVPAVANAIAQSLTRPRGEGGGEYLVFGSSSGWMVFYGAIAYGLRSRGVELMEHLDRTANLVLDELRGTRASRRQLDVVFDKGDVLDTDIASVSLLLLASQCWDSHLKDKVRAKIEGELPANGIVIDYSDTILGQSTVMKLVGETAGKVSWNERQRFYIYGRA